MPKDDLELQAQDEFDAAWNEDATDNDDQHDEGDTSYDAADDEQYELDDEQTDEQEEAEMDEGEADEDDAEPNDDKETQRLKSWEGRLRAEEARIKREREEWERRHKETYPDNENQADNYEQDTDDSGPDEFESEFPEFAEYAKRKIEPLQQKLSAYEQEKARLATEVHAKRITASHPDAFELAQSQEFDAWIESQPFKTAQQYFHIKQQGSAEEVIAMLDDFKSQTKRSTPQAQHPSSVKTRRTAKPKGRVAKDDFDGAWADATSN